MGQQRGRLRRLRQAMERTGHCHVWLLPSFVYPLGNPANRFLHIPLHLFPSRRWGLTAREPGAVATLDIDTALGGLSLEAVQVGGWELDASPQRCMHGSLPPFCFRAGADACGGPSSN